MERNKFGDRVNHRIMNQVYVMVWNKVEDRSSAWVCDPVLTWNRIWTLAWFRFANPIREQVRRNNESK